MTARRRSFFSLPLACHQWLPSAEVTFWCLLLLLLPLFIALSFDFGITWDDQIQQEYGKHIFNFYTSGFQNTVARHYSNLYLYGGFFEFCNVLMSKLLPFLDEYDARHLCNSIFGWLAFCFTGLLGRRLYGPGVGLIAVLLLITAPRFVADCMNNSKDLPFATGYVASLYALTFVRRRYPYFTYKVLAGVLSALAVTMNIRMGVVFLFGLTGLLLLALVWKDKYCRNTLGYSNWPAWLTLASAFGFGVLIAMVLGTLFWPWALASPLSRPFLALKEIAHFHQWHGTLLFNGKWLQDVDVPRHYILTWYAIGMPLPQLVGFGLALLLFIRRVEIWRPKLRPIKGRPDGRILTGLLLASVFLPLAIAMSIRPILYDGLRHLLFIATPMTVLAAAAWFYLIRTSNHLKIANSDLPLGRGLVAALLAICLIHPIEFMLREHPNQTVYFNELIGGTRGAFLRYEMDYWGNSYKQAVDRLRVEAIRMGRPLRIGATNGSHIVAQYAARYPEALHFIADDAPQDYHLWLLRDAPHFVPVLLAQPDLVDRITADGVALCLVFRGNGPSNPAFEAAP
ncbi:putative PMT_2 domain-containing protein [Desulfovibrionales bacterium]